MQVSPRCGALSGLWVVVEWGSPGQFGESGPGRRSKT